MSNSAFRLFSRRGERLRGSAATSFVHIRKGRITGLIGPNGAGKTTFFNCISGVYVPSEGSIIFDGRHIEGRRGFQINEAGIARTYQIINLFRKMTVLENVMVGMHSRLKSGFFKNLLHTPSMRREDFLKTYRQ